MANIIPQFDLSNINSSTEFMKDCSIVVGQIVSALNGQLDFGNLKTQAVSVTFSSAANANTSVPHNLNKTGVMYFVVSKSAAGDIYSGTGDTSSVLHLKSSVGGVTVSLILF